jgi:HEAT repeat protein
VRALERPEPLASSAAQALGRLGTRHYDEVRILVSSRGLHGPEAPYLCRVLGVCGRVDDAPLLRTALGADLPAVRRAAAEALAALPISPESSRSREIDEALLFALADESTEVRAQAARALGLHGRALSTETLDGLERAAHDPEIAVRVAAARAVGQIALTSDRHPRALSVLRRLADSADPAAAVPALESLGRADSEAEDDARLLAALDAQDAEVVKAAARALGARANSPSAALARTGLQTALRDRRWDVRCVAAAALAEHGTSAHPILYAHRAAEQDPSVLEAIDRALQAAMAR